MSTRTPTTTTDPELSDESTWNYLECPVDGQLLEAHHQQPDGRFECPCCQNRHSIWEVAR